MERATLCVLRSLLVLALLPRAAAAPCPRPCSCPQPSELHCTFRSLLSIPAAVPKHMERINLGFNSINKVSEKSLSGLRRLELLLIHGNNIHVLPDGVFRDLTSLQMLKISYNKLKEISRDMLQGLWALVRLHLDHNQLEFIHPDTFQGLTSLRLLQLDGNRLQQLHPTTFSTFTVWAHFYISTLRHLYLSDNRLMSLPSRLMKTMPKLENLYLHSNPWSCDCNMGWLPDWEKTSPGVLKCKKDTALPGDKLCPVCSSPRHLNSTELQAVENLACHSPVITSLHRTTSAEDTEMLSAEDLKGPMGNITLDLSDEHGNNVDLQCSVSEPEDLLKINWEQINQHQLVTNVTFSVELDCPVNREKYEQLWRLIAYYSSVPAHLKQGGLLSQTPQLSYSYHQDSVQDAQYYTGVKVKMTAQPVWLMQPFIDLQLNRLQSSAKTVKLILGTEMSKTVETEQEQRQKRPWVLIESTNRTRKVLTAVLGSPSEMHCTVHSSEQPGIQWLLPNGSRLNTTHLGPDTRVSVSQDGTLKIKAVSHRDTGIYYCISWVHGDFAFLSFYLSVHESSSPPPGEDTAIPSIQKPAGNPVSMDCNASASPDAEITWILPNSNMVSFQANWSKGSVLSNGTLHIPQIQLSDSGYYRCVAMNQHGVDTQVQRITVMRRKGLIRPVQKFPVGPQSASGVSTQIKVPSVDTEEASGDIQMTQNGAPTSRLDVGRRRISGGVASVRRGIHPSRNTWHRPLVLRKPIGPHDQKHTAGNRRRIHISKNQIDPEKWANILGKIRDRNAPNSITPLPVQSTTRTRTTEQAKSPETPKQSSDRVTEKENQLDLAHTSEEHAHQENRKNTYSNEVTPNSFTEFSTSLNYQHTNNMGTTIEQQQTHSVHDTHPDRKLDLHSTSDSLFSLPETTSVPLHAITSWQANTNTAGSSIFSPQGTNADVNESVNPNKPSQIEEEDGKYLSETSTMSQLHPQTKDSSLNDFQPEAVSTTSPPVPTTTRKKGSEAPSLRKPSSRRRNGGQKRRSNRKKHKLKPSAQFLPTTPEYSPLQMVGTSASTVLKTEATVGFSNTVLFTKRKAASSGRKSNKKVSRQDQKTGTKTSDKAKPLFQSSSFPTASPGTAYRVTTSYTTSRSQSPPEIFTSVSRPKVTNNPPQLDKLSENTQKPTVELKPLLYSDDLIWHFQSVTRSPADSSEHQHRFIHQEGKDTGLGSSLLPPSFTSAVSFTERGNRTISGKTSSGQNTTPHRLSEQDLETEEVTTMMPNNLDHSSGLNEITTTWSKVHPKLKNKQNRAEAAPSTGISLTPPIVQRPRVTPSTVMPLTPKTVELPRVTPFTAVSWTPKTVELPKVKPSTVMPLTPKTVELPRVTPFTAVSWTPKTVELPKVKPSTVMPLTPPTVELPRVTSSTAVSWTPKTVELPRVTSSTATLWTPQTVAPTRVTLSTGAPSLTQRPRIMVNQGHDKLRNFTTAALETVRKNNFTVKSPSQKQASVNPTAPDLRRRSNQTSTPVPTTTVFQSKPLMETPSTVTKDGSTKHQQPVAGGKPKITKSSLQTVTVKVETDAELPCQTEGQPRPFLSWTKVATGESLTLNMRTQRFEVHPNGTLTIRNSQLMDSGQYLCTVQNEYGSDKMLVNLLVLFQPPQVLEPRLRDITVNLGGKVELECKVEGYPVPLVTWVLPSHVQLSAASGGVDSQWRVTVNNEGTLWIKQSTFTDSGTYRCIGSSAAGVDAVSVNLRVSDQTPVIQQTQQENITLPEGSSAYINCNATGTPQPVIHWITPDGIALTALQTVSGQNFIVFPNGTLYIQRLRPRNSGKYECSNSNTISSSHRIVMLTVRRNLLSAKATIISSSPQKTDVMYGNKLLLNCGATGEPEPRILWRTPSKKLVDAQYSFDPRIKAFLNGSITIHSVTEKDAGEYLCVARNKMGDDYIQFRVNVLTRPAKIKRKHDVPSQEVVYGEDLKVDCVASGLPNPEITWALPDGTMVNPVKHREGAGAGRSRRYVVFENGTLYFKDVGMPEEGDYTCYAENQLGKDEMKVRVKVKTAMSTPQIQDKDQNTVRVSYGETVKLQCHAKGDPVPAITWMSPANRVISSGLDKYWISKDGTLVIQKVQRLDDGNYTCMARNSAGQDYKVIRLEVVVSPPVINNLRGAVNAVQVMAVQGQRRQLDCVAKGTPTPYITWILQGNTVLPAPHYSNRMTVYQNGTLEIRSPKKTDSGQLVCVAHNEGGEVRLVINLDVKENAEKPQMRDHEPDSLSLRVGKTMTLNCSFQGLKLPHLTWILPDGKPLHTGARFSKFFHRLDGSLIISNPTIAEAGLYRCMGRSPAGLVERTVKLSPGRKPDIQNRYRSPVQIMNGETLFLHCQASGEPVRLTWTLPSGVVLNRLQRAGRYAIMPNGTLAILHVSVYDRGAYVCRAANEYGSSVLSASVIVTTHAPRITSSPPSVTYVKRGVAVQLNCAAIGIPKVEVAWETPDKTRLAVGAQPRLFGNKYIHPQGSLIIQNPTQRDAGVYRCTARNTIGIDSKTTILNVF